MLDLSSFGGRHPLLWDRAWREQVRVGDLVEWGNLLLLVTGFEGNMLRMDTYYSYGGSAYKNDGIGCPTEMSIQNRFDAWIRRPIVANSLGELYA